MSDDQNSKTMDINDLVRELSKSSASPATPPAPQAMRPPFSTPNSPVSSPPPSSSTTPPPPVGPLPIRPLEMTKPQFNVPPQTFSQPKPAPSPVAPLPTTPDVKEYQSSIRTMNEDISKLKQGQKPTGIDIPRKVEQVVSVPQTPSPAGQVKPTVPSQQFKVPSVNLGETRKTAPIASVNNIPRAPSAPKVEPKTQIYVPQEGQKGGNRRNMLFMGIGAIVLVSGFSYWFFVLRSPVPEVVIESPTPRPSPTETPIQSLLAIFSGVQTQTFLVTPNETVNDFIQGVKNGNINGGEFIKIHTSDDDTSLTITQFLDNFKLSYPTNLGYLIGQDSSILIYGQKEIFDFNGQLKTDAVVEKRLAFVSEVRDAVMVLQAGRVWETEMTENLKTIFQLDPNKQAGQDFADNFYRGVGIRYKNFPYADKSIDYAVVTSFNGKSYLVITGSRETMYATIDKLKGF